MVKLFNFDLAKLTVFSINTAHTDEHYGNMVTYLRLKVIVPPTSENQSAQRPKKEARTPNSENRHVLVNAVNALCGYWNEHVRFPTYRALCGTVFVRLTEDTQG